MLLDICKQSPCDEKNETMPKRKSCTSRDGAWPIESDMFEYRFYNQSEYRTSSSCELFDQTHSNAALAHTTFDQVLSLTVNLLLFHFSCRFFEQQTERRKDRFKFTFKFKTCKTFETTAVTRTSKKVHLPGYIYLLTV